MEGCMGRAPAHPLQGLLEGSRGPGGQGGGGGGNTFACCLGASLIVLRHRPLSWPGGSSENPRLRASFCGSSPRGLEPLATRFLPSTEAALHVRSDARPPVHAVNLLPPSHCAKLRNHSWSTHPSRHSVPETPCPVGAQAPIFLLKSLVMLPGRVNFIHTALAHTQCLHWQVRILKSDQDFQDPSSRAKWTGKG